MRSLNIKFQEEYKSVDKFIKDAYGSSEGVSEYIRQMDSNSKGSYSFPSWDEDYRMLKHLRWIRNQLAHEVSIESDICEDEDYDWICEFHDRLMDGDDSLAKWNRKQNELQRRNSKPKASTSVSNPSYHNYSSTKNNRDGGKGLIGIIAVIVIIGVAVLAVKFLL